MESKQTVDLKKLSVTELKAMKCDQLDLFADIQRNIQILGAEIQKRIDDAGRNPEPVAEEPKA